ncbi:MAG: hypothetical protein ACTSVY_15085 [Candidatus Helarchaeota archaeon]
MKFEITTSAKEKISELVSDLLDLEDDMKQEDIAIIIYLQKASCGPMTSGGWKTVTVTVELYKNFEQDLQLELISRQEVLNLPIYIEKEALNLLNEMEPIVIDVKGAIVKELFIVNAPIIDLGACNVTFL